MNSELVISRPLPVEQAIHWKPLRDAHYILASLQPADGGRRQIVARQRVLADVQSQLRASHGRLVGVLLGRFYRCPVTGADYEVIDSVIECSAVDDPFSAIAGGLEIASHQEGTQVLGWYCSAPALGPKLSGTLAAIHRAHFQNPWQATLVVADGTSGSGGAFFLYDDDAARWFYAPFYELPDSAPGDQQAKPTCITWPQYLTVEQVVLVRPEERTTISAESEPTPAAPPAHHSIAANAPFPDDRADTPSPAAEPAPPFDPRPMAPKGLLAQLTLQSDHAPRLTPNARDETATASAPDVLAEPPAERGADTADGTPVEKTPILDDRRQWFAALRRAIRRAGESRGTRKTTEAERFLEEARSAGFVVAATFPSIAKPKAAQALWVLIDPAAGILLTVVTTDAQVLDATLHYNLHSDEPALLDTFFPEHRDLASRTVYVRETCLDSFSARCRRLRETPGLEREWKVSPVIYFLTPGEWRLLTARPADSEHDIHRIHTLNEERIRALAEPIRQQFGLEASPSQ